MWTEICLAFGIQLVGWLFATLCQTEKFYDLTGSITFLIIVHYIVWTRLSSLVVAQIVQQFCISAWTFRLGAFLFWRVLNSGEDRRFRRIKTRPLVFLGVWLMQGFWVIMALLPSLIMWHEDVRPGTPVSTIQVVGWLIWAAGFIFETIADYQKSQFRSKPENKDKFIQHGLWAISRHPNYFGEILLWFGLYISASTTFTRSTDWLSILGPLFNAFLILRVSGIPLLEAHAEKKWGSSTEYRKYKSRTPVLVPYVW